MFGCESNLFISISFSTLSFIISSFRICLWISFRATKFFVLVLIALYTTAVAPTPNFSNKI